MSAVTDIDQYLIATITDLLPYSKPLPYQYLQDYNDRVADHNYAVKAGKATNVSSTNNSLTLEQEFIIDLSKRYTPKKPSGDADAKAKALELYAESETLYKALARRSGGLTSCLLLLISPVDVSEPTIDNDNNLVTVTLTLAVKYRVAT